MAIRRWAIATLVGLFGLAAVATAQESRPAPEGATGVASKALAVSSKHMVVAADPRAAEAGREILRAGGSAVDAAIAVQMVLGLVEPQSSGLGGGAFLIHWDAAGRAVKTYDGRETAPAAAKPDRFLLDGQPMPFDDAVHSGLSVGVPGVLRMLELAHQKHGKLPWAQVFAPAIRLAEDGFAVSPRLGELLARTSPDKFAPGARAYFFDATGRARPAGFVLKNPEYAATLKTIAEKGASAFYEGPLAEQIVAAAGAAPIAKSDLALADLSNYAAKERDPVCFSYRTRRICGMGPPSSGGLTVAQTLKLIEPFAEVQGPGNAMSGAALHIIADAEKLSFADRNRYIGDPDAVSIPAGLLDDGYLDERRKLIDTSRALVKADAGTPPGLAKKAFGADATHEVAGTSHVSIVDDQGNAVAMTTTIESGFGSHLWAAGFLLNNQLTDFSMRPVDKEGVPVANSVAGGKRPRSSMAPTLVFDANGNLEMVTGSPGGSKIILYVVKTLVASLDWGLDAQASAALLNFGSEGGPFEIEYGLSALWPSLKVKTYGHALAVDEMTSGVHTIMRRDGHWEGGADPRREGAAAGD